MELEQLAKRLEWLDDERRKDKTVIATLEERIRILESTIPSTGQQMKDLSGEITRVATNLARLDQFDSAIGQVRVDYSRSVETIEKARADHERETEKLRRVELEGVNKAIAEVRKGLDPIPEMRRMLQARQEEDFRLGRLIEEVEQKVVVTKRYDEEYKRSIKLLEEGYRQDSKRLTDVQGESAAVRKRVDEQRGRMDLLTDSLRKLETRLNELQSAEGERRNAQVTFVEKQNLAQVERERTWREWQTRFEVIEKTSTGLDAQILALDATHRSVKRSQEMLDEVSQRFDRRITEITEMQRLVEDRFRQEWVAYKADDQKRWTNYSLAQEEQMRESTRLFDKLADRLVALEEMSHEVQDMLEQINDETEKRLQALLTLTHEWMNTYESVFAKSKNTIMKA